MSKDFAIKVSNVTKEYKLYDSPLDRLKESLSITHKKYSKSHFALHNISFEINSGETVGFMGRNGAGKSTLLKILTGVTTPSSGLVEVNGTISALLELGAGFNPDYTGLQNIYLNGTMLGYSKEEMADKIDGILEFADIGDFVGQPVKTYSSGMFARLAFAVAVNVQPEILIVDEVLSVGDMRFQMKCMNKMKELMTQGATVLFVSHDINAVRRFCNRGIWLNDGQLMADGDIECVSAQYADFLKVGTEGFATATQEIQQIKAKENSQLKPFVASEGVAEIIDFRMNTTTNRNVDTAKACEPVEIEVIYDVYDTNIVKPVLGIAVFSINDDYFCGLNTLLDQIEIPWQYGRNHMVLHYHTGIRATGGKYYFDCAIYDNTATVTIHHCKQIKTFSIESEYIGEGRTIIPHKWKK